MPYFLTPLGSKLPRGRFSKHKSKHKQKYKDYVADYSNTPKYMTMIQSDSVTQLYRFEKRIKQGLRNENSSNPPHRLISGKYTKSHEREWV